MKKTVFVRFLSVLLCLSLLLPCAALSVPADAAGESYFTIYVRGSTNIYKFHADGTRSAIYDDGDYVVSLLAKAAPLLAAARVTGDYTAYADKVLEIMRPAYDDFRPSLTDGSVPEDTHVDWTWSRESVYQAVSSSSYIEYWIDERLSPFAQAADLNEFIETVREISGRPKVLLYARCLGPVTLFTYLYEYQRPKNYEDVVSLMISFSTHNGMSLTDAVYTGSVEIPASGMETWLAPTVTDAIGEDTSAGLLNAVSALLTGIAKSLGVKLTVKELNRLYTELKDVLFRPFLLEYYGLCLENLACVNEKFDQMMDYLFPAEVDRQTYAFAIGELTRYHETVYPAINVMIQELIDQGKPFAIMADYGGQEYPVSEDATYLGDFQVGTRAMSLGATVAKVGGTLDADYVAARQAEGLGEYISPDNKVDASTCAFPEHTYFVSNLNHEWPGKYADIELSVIRTEDDVRGPVRVLERFVYWDEEAQDLVPLETVLTPEEEPAPTGIRGFFRRIGDFFRSLIQKARDFFVRLG